MFSWSYFTGPRYKLAVKSIKNFFSLFRLFSPSPTCKVIANGESGVLLPNLNATSKSGSTGTELIWSIPLIIWLINSPEIATAKYCCIASVTFTEGLSEFSLIASGFIIGRIALAPLAVASAADCPISLPRSTSSSKPVIFMFGNIVDFTYAVLSTLS